MPWIFIYRGNFREQVAWSSHSNRTGRDMTAFLDDGLETVNLVIVAV